MKRRILAYLILASFANIASAQVPNPTEEECLGLIAVLPTFESPEMKAYYEKSRGATTGKQVAEKLRAVADSGNKDAQFTLSMLLLNGYCVPQDICAARKYREKSRGAANDWENVALLHQSVAGTETICQDKAKFCFLFLYQPATFVF